MASLIQIFRLITLSVLSGGSAGIIFAAINFVKVAQAKGMTIAQAASYNAPLFINYSKIALTFTVILLICELIDFLFNRKLNRLKLMRYGSSILCFGSAFIFAQIIVPAMEVIRPQIYENTEAHTAFNQLHHSSEIVFALIIMFALVSLLVPIFKTD